MSKDDIKYDEKHAHDLSEKQKIQNWKQLKEEFTQMYNYAFSHYFKKLEHTEY